mgnify:CR=1 FL=1
MEKVKVEFVNTCSCCASYEEQVKEVARQFGDKVEVRIYQAGKDFDYIKKYGNLTRGTLIINSQTKYDNLNREIIEKAIKDAVAE